MKPEDLFDIIGETDPELLERSETAQAGRGRVVWLKWACAAACACFLAALGLQFLPGPGKGPLPTEPSLSPGPAVTSRAPEETSGPQSTPGAGQSPAESRIPPETPAPVESRAPEKDPLPTESLAPTPSGGELPLLTTRPEDKVGMGYDGVTFHDISESGNANPWTEDAALSTLPVYRNLAYRAPGIPDFCLTDAELLDLAERAADSLDTGLISLEYERIQKTSYEDGYLERFGLQGGEPWLLVALTQNNDQIRTFSNGTVGLIFAEPKPLPEGYRLENVSDAAAEEAVSRFLEEQAPLLERFSWITDLTDPVVDTWAQYSIHGEPWREYHVFSGSGDLEERILNYNFRWVYLGLGETDRNAVGAIHFHNIIDCRAAEKLGDYPLISPEEARALLLDGSYVAQVPADYLKDGAIREEDIAKVTLVYRTEPLNPFYQPYYLFYVELEEEPRLTAQGLKDFGKFYVPAVSGEYLTDFPSWSGSYK